MNNYEKFKDEKASYTLEEIHELANEVWKVAQIELLERFFRCGILNVNEYNSELEKLEEVE